MLKKLVSEQEMHTLAEQLAAQAQIRDVICLWGDLGAGKTSFARGFLKGLNVEGPVPSPTFTCVQTYETSAGEVWHYDLYRISHEDELEEIGFQQALTSAITLIEWPQRLSSFLPKDRLDIHLDFVKNKQLRQLQLTGHGLWKSRESILKQLLIA